MAESTQVERLADILRRLNAGEDPAAIREEAREFLATINTADLSAAEQKLIDAGLAPEDLRHLCSVHMEVLGDQLGQLKARLCPGNMVHTLVVEHEHILGFLDEIEAANKAIQEATSYDEIQSELDSLRHAAEHLLHAEPHHEREEEVLFPELEQRGITGPPRIMRMEHEDLRRRKHEINELAVRFRELEYSEFKRRLDAAVGFIVLALRDHIWKEDNILYPTAVQVIQDDGVWERLKERADEIGYCCFTPQE